MKAVSLWQPWASLVALGAKQIETRSYPPARLGLTSGQRIAIHAAKRTSELWLCQEPYFCDFVADPEKLPLGALIATCTIGRSRTTTSVFAGLLDRQEYAFGLYAPGRWAWELLDVKPLVEPVPFRGHQGAFDVPDELVAS